VKKGEVIDKNILIPDGKTTEVKGWSQWISLLIPLKRRSPQERNQCPGKDQGEIKEGQKLEKSSSSLIKKPLDSRYHLPCCHPKGRIFYQVF